MLEIDKFPLIASFLAGIMTFVSPCVLPLIPAYISFITGASLDKLKGGKTSLNKTFLNSLFFVIGFSLIFILLGASASYLGSFVGANQAVLRWIGGTIVIIFGLHIAGIINIKFLYFEKRIDTKKIHLGYFGSFFIGVAFAIGWTPCIGPILSSILILASTQNTIYKGIVLLTSYSLGLAIPFLITALFINLALKMFDKIKRVYRYIEIVSGIILVIVGILVISDSFGKLTGFFLDLFS